MNFISAHKNNFKVGRDGQSIKYIIIHTIVGSQSSCIATFKDPSRIASAHYVVGYDGSIVQMVKDTDTAYHAGNWTINTQSIGIEHDDQAKPNSPRPAALYNASGKLVGELCKKYNIPIDRKHIRKHSEVSDAPTACPASLNIDRIVEIAKGVDEMTDLDACIYAWRGITNTMPSTKNKAVFSEWLKKGHSVPDIIRNTIFLGYVAKNYATKADLTTCQKNLTEQTAVIKNLNEKIVEMGKITTPAVISAPAATQSLPAIKIDPKDAPIIRFVKIIINWLLK